MGPIKLFTSAASSLAISIIVILACSHYSAEAGCKDLWVREGIRDPSCTNSYPYVPLLNGVYCYNNGSGICKAFAGQFEFYFNSFTDQYLYPAPQSDYVDSTGYHKRIPVSYNIRGDINYADRSINWAKTFKENLKGRKISLLSTRDFNWCGYTENDWWPYKSSIIDAKSKGRFHIYFHNRQSCILDTQSGLPPQHFNTRFLHKSDLRIDLDYNPTIFAMEDNKAGGDIRLVKHKRQHWYEVKFQVIEKPTPSIDYFVDMAITQEEPCKINGNTGQEGCVISANAFPNTSDLCLNENWLERAPGSKNARLFEQWCGIEEMEIADWTWPIYSRKRNKFLECDLHNLPRKPTTSERFFGIDINSDADWEAFAKDGFVFSAMTTIPIEDPATNKTDPDRVRVLLLYSSYDVEAQNKYDEYYPMPYLADYIAQCENCDSDTSNWAYQRAPSQKSLSNLNYVDDIAFLHKCDTILIIFGPLYSEVDKNKFDIDTKAPVDSIDKLGIYEPANAFFGQPETNTLWVYHRTNWVASYKYTCRSGPDNLVTAVRSGNYMPRHGSSQPEVFLGSNDYSRDEQVDISEETLFEVMGVFKGTIRPEAPDPALYPLGQGDPDQPKSEGNNTVLYIIIGLAILVLLAMCVACLTTFRRHRKHRRRELDGGLTQRSSGALDSRLSPSKRSSLSTSKPATSGLIRNTFRSAMGGSKMSSSGAPSTRSMMRSRSRSKPNPSLGGSGRATTRSSGGSKYPASRPGVSIRSGMNDGSTVVTRPSTGSQNSGHSGHSSHATKTQRSSPTVSTRTQQ